MGQVGFSLPPTVHRISILSSAGGPKSEIPDGKDASSDEDGPGLFIFHGLIPSSEYLLTFLVPAVIIVCMLVLAICLACLLHRKRRAGKLNLFYSEALPPRVPVILQDELYDQQDPQSAGTKLRRGGGLRTCTYCTTKLGTDHLSADVILAEHSGSDLQY